jgi:hypothetical protein
MFHTEAIQISVLNNLVIDFILNKTPKHFYELCYTWWECNVIVTVPDVLLLLVKVKYDVHMLNH